MLKPIIFAVATLFYLMLYQPLEILDFGLIILIKLLIRCKIQLLATPILIALPRSLAYRYYARSQSAELAIRTLPVLSSSLLEPCVVVAAPLSLERQGCTRLAGTTVQHVITPMIQRWRRSYSYCTFITNSAVRNTCHLCFHLSSSSSSHAVVLFFLTVAVFPVCSTFSVPRHRLPVLVASKTYGDRSFQKYSRQSRMVSTRSRTVAVCRRGLSGEGEETGELTQNRIIVSPESIKDNEASDMKKRRTRNKKITTDLNSLNPNDTSQPCNGVIDQNITMVLESYGRNGQTNTDFSSFTFRTTPDKQLGISSLNFDKGRNDDKSASETSTLDFATPSAEKKPLLRLTSSSSSKSSKRKLGHTKETTPTRTISKEVESIEPPKGWEDIYSIVEELRSDRTAPVDLCGPAVIIEKHLGEKVFRFQVLIALMLSSQTKDNVVCDAMKKLQRVSLCLP